MEAGQQLRDFILEVKLGAGGVGEVWRARHQHLDKLYAIKAVFPHLSTEHQFHDRFFQEAKAMGQLDHPHIVGLHDFFYLDGNSYLVMSYIEGGSLEDLIKKRGRLPLEQVLKISSGILDALDFAHSKGVIHRDVKPSNILMRPDGHAYLVDFGIALVVGTPRMTQFGKNIGTLEYMSPEQIRADEGIDHLTDVYSFGCVVYEMLTGNPPFGSIDAGKTDFDVMNGHINTPPPSLGQLMPEIDEHTDRVVARAMAKAPNERYGGCKEMAEDLESQRGNDSRAGTGSARQLKKLERTRNYLFVAVIVLLISTVIASAGWLSQTSGGGNGQKNLAGSEENRQLKAEIEMLRADQKILGTIELELDECQNELAKLKRGRQ